MSKTVNAGSLLPWPSGWSTPGPTASRVLATGIVGLLLLGIAGFGISRLASGERAGPAVILGVGFFSLCTLTALDLWMLRRRRCMPTRKVALRATGSDYDGVAIFYSTRFYHLLRTLLLVTVVIVAGYGAGGILGWLTPPSTPPSDATAALTGGAALCVLLAWVAWSVWVVVEVARGRVVRGRLVLRPDGIYHCSFTFEHFVPWHAVVDVSAKEFRGPAIVVTAFPTEDTRLRRITRVGKQEESILPPSLVVCGHSLAVDPAVAYHALRYYHAHPEARTELLTRAGEHRIRSGSLPDEQKMS